MKSDAQLQDDVLSELRLETQMREGDVSATVTSGVVAIAGTVAEREQKTAAQEAAHRVPGVLDVVNDVKVCQPGSMPRSDLAIAQAVRLALQQDGRLPDAAIRSTVARGWVTLEGDVCTWLERDAAERAISPLEGVRGVVNAIDIRKANAGSERN